MRSPYSTVVRQLVAAGFAIALVGVPTLAAARDVSPRAVTPPRPSSPMAAAPALAATLPTANQKAGCGAVLTILGGVAERYPETFAKGGNGKNIQALLSAFGAKGKQMLDEAYAEGAAAGQTPTQTFQAGLAYVFDTIPADKGPASGDMGRKVGMTLMQNCTGMDIN